MLKIISQSLSSIKNWQLTKNHSIFSSLLVFIAILVPLFPSFAQSFPNSLDPNCPAPVLSRLRRHKVASGETIASIAQRYKLAPETLIKFNENLSKGKARVGQVVLVPPFNGMKLTVPKGATWQDIAKAYGIRSDLLFEINGCQKNPTVVFIPGVSWTPTAQKPKDTYLGLSSYPLPASAKIGLDYGWQTNPQTKQTFFHSGVDLLAAIDTPVLAASDGTVILVSKEGPYGFLVVVDHGEGRQTRYAQLNRFQVAIGQSVKAGETLGFVGTTGRPDIPQPHLHFEVRFQSPVGWVAQDPKLHLPKVKS
ncbi:MAG: M23 family metallopeptidase [Snowella sp.]|nr:M23 family metallopeptidase [Snowella sp.]